jgi:hypothetical protein
MRSLSALVLLAPLLLAACGDDERPVIIQPQPSTVVVPPASSGTVVVPQGSATKVCPPGTVC